MVKRCFICGAKENEGQCTNTSCLRCKKPKNTESEVK